MRVRVAIASAARPAAHSRATIDVGARGHLCVERTATSGARQRAEQSVGRAARRRTTRGVETRERCARRRTKLRQCRRRIGRAARAIRHALTSDSCSAVHLARHAVPTLHVLVAANRRTAGLTHVLFARVRHCVAGVHGQLLTLGALHARSRRTAHVLDATDTVGGATCQRHGTRRVRLTSTGRISTVLLTDVARPARQIRAALDRRRAAATPIDVDHALAQTAGYVASIALSQLATRCGRIHSATARLVTAPTLHAVRAQTLAAS